MLIFLYFLLTYHKNFVKLNIELVRMAENLPGTPAACLILSTAMEGTARPPY